MSTFQIGRKPPAGFDDPVGKLRDCHRKIEARLESLPRIVAALRAGLGDARPALDDVLAYFEGGARLHTEDEEFSVFPRVAGDETRELLARLDGEHREHEAIYLAFRTVAAKIAEGVGDVDPALCSELEQHTRALAAAYRDHIAVEEAELLPIAAALPPPELRAIGIEMRLRRGGD